MQTSRGKRGGPLSLESGTNHKPVPPSKMDYETKFFPRIGGFGRYTKRVVVWSWFPSFAVALNLASTVFLTMTPESFHCRPDPWLLPTALPISNLTEKELIKVSIPWDKDSGLSRCELLKYLNGSTGAPDSNAIWEKVPCTKGWEYDHKAGLNNNFVTEVCLAMSVFCSLEVRTLLFPRLFPFSCCLLCRITSIDQPHTKSGFGKCGRN